MDDQIYNSYLEIDLNNLIDNIRFYIQIARPGTAVIPVLKGNAYGCGMPRIAEEISARTGINTFGTAHVSEAVALKAALPHARAIVLGGVPPHLFEHAVRAGAEIPVFTSQAVRRLAQLAAEIGLPQIDVHLKIETGLGRIGAKPGPELGEIISALADCPSVRPAGVFSQFSDAENTDDSLLKKQFALFESALAQLAQAGIHPPLAHIANSTAAENFPSVHLGAVRIGRGLYMPAPGDTSGNIREVASWRGYIVNIRELAPGESAGYAGAYTAAAPVKIATLSVGYGDGLVPALAQKHAPVLVNDREAKLVAVCMDQCFADVTGIECAIGDEVTFFGRSRTGVSLESDRVASLIGEEGVFLTGMLGRRVGRVYI